MVTPKMGTNKFTQPYEMPWESAKLTPELIEVMNMLYENRKPYAPNSQFKYMTKTSAKSKYVGKTVALFYTNSDADYNLGGIIGMSYAGDLGNMSVSFENNEQGAAFFRDHLFQENSNRNWILVPHGAKRYINILRTTYAISWLNDGYDVQILPSSSGSAIIIVTKGKSSWTFVDYTQHIAREPELVHGYEDAILTPESDPLLTATLLLDYVHEIEDELMAHFGIHTSLTYAATGVQLHKKHFAPDLKVWRPSAEMSYWLRGTDSPLGGYITATPYSGNGFEVDQRRAYSKAMAEDIPFQFVMGNPFKDGVLRPGIYLSTITINAPISIYLRAYDNVTQAFRNRHHRYGTHLAIIPSCEFEGLRAIGCEVTPHFGWVAMHSFTMRPLIEEVERVIDEAGEHSAFTKTLKVMVNSIPGKFASNPIMEEIMLSDCKPGDDWKICQDAFGEEIEHNWRRQVENHKPYMNVAAAEWIYASQRNDVYLFLAEEYAAGNTMVHWAVDGGLLVGTPSTDMPMKSKVRGTFVLKDWNCDIEVFGPNHNIVNGVVKHAGEAKYTTQETRLVLFCAPELVSDEAPLKPLPRIDKWAAMMMRSAQIPADWASVAPR